MSRQNLGSSPVDEAELLDQEFVEILLSIEATYKKLSKHLQIRVEKWIVKLIQNDETVRWKHNRNNYLKLMNFMIETSKIAEPFSAMPTDKDLPYLSEHELNQKIKPHFNGKYIFQHKPDMLKIEEPQGDSCSVLLSIVQTARSQSNFDQMGGSSRSNGRVQDVSNQIKESKLIDGTPQLFSFSRNSQMAVNTGVSTSVIPSNLPSQIKTAVTKYSKVNPVPKQETEKHNEIMFLMGKILLKHEFTLQKEKEYWNLIKVISNYFNKDIEEFLESLKVSKVGESSEKCEHRSPQQGSAQQRFDRINRITEESVDFRVEEGIEPSQILAFELKDKQNQEQIVLEYSNREHFQEIDDGALQCHRQMEVYN